MHATVVEAHETVEQFVFEQGGVHAELVIPMIFDAVHDKPHRCGRIPAVGLYRNEIRPKIPFARMIVQSMGEINEFPIFHHVLLAFSMNSRRYGSSMSMGWLAKTMPPSWMGNGGVRLVLCSLAYFALPALCFANRMGSALMWQLRQRGPLHIWLRGRMRPQSMHSVDVVL